MKSFQSMFSILALSLSWQTLLAESPTGQVFGWGNNICGESTGVPSSAPSNGVVTINGWILNNIVAVAAGTSHSLALRNDGTVFGWGWNRLGQAMGVETVNPENTNGFVTIAGRMLTNIMAIAAGNNFSLALRSNGTIVAWGDNSRQGCDVPQGLSNVVAIAAGWTCSIALRKDGTVVGWGAPKVPHDLSNVVAIATGGGYLAPSLALLKNGTIVQWGANGLEEPIPAGLTGVRAIAVGGDHCLALKSDGTVFGWGLNGCGEATGAPTTNSSYRSSGSVTISGQVLSNVTAVAAGEYYSLALNREGNVVAWGYMQSRPAIVPRGLSNALAITVGKNFCLAITTNGGASTTNK